MRNLEFRMHSIRRLSSASASLGFDSFGGRRGPARHARAPRALAAALGGGGAGVTGRGVRACVVVAAAVVVVVVGGGGRHGGLEAVAADFARLLDASRAAADRGESVRDQLRAAYGPAIDAPPSASDPPDASDPAP
jgi:hypothetical protein